MAMQGERRPRARSRPRSGIGEEMARRSRDALPSDQVTYAAAIDAGLVEVDAAVVAVVAVEAASARPVLLQDVQIERLRVGTGCPAAAAGIGIDDAIVDAGEPAPGIGIASPAGRIHTVV